MSLPFWEFMLCMCVSVCTPPFNSSLSSSFSLPHLLLSSPSLFLKPPSHSPLPHHPLSSSSPPSSPPPPHPPLPSPFLLVSSTSVTQGGVTESATHSRVNVGPATVLVPWPQVLHVSLLVWCKPLFSLDCLALFQLCVCWRAKSSIYITNVQLVWIIHFSFSAYRCHSGSVHTHIQYTYNVCVEPSTGVYCTVPGPFKNAKLQRSTR